MASPVLLLPLYSQGPSTDPELIYSAYQPVYGRCKKVVDMPAFSELIAKSCGNIHEYENVAYPCVQAMQQSSQKMGLLPLEAHVLTSLNRH